MSFHEHVLQSMSADFTEDIVAMSCSQNLVQNLCDRRQKAQWRFLSHCCVVLVVLVIVAVICILYCVLIVLVDVRVLHFFLSMV